MEQTSVSLVGIFLIIFNLVLGLAMIGFLIFSRHGRKTLSVLLLPLLVAAPLLLAVFTFVGYNKLSRVEMETTGIGQPLIQEVPLMVTPEVLELQTPLIQAESAPDTLQPVQVTEEIAAPKSNLIAEDKQPAQTATHVPGWFPQEDSLSSSTGNHVTVLPGNRIMISSGRFVAQTESRSAAVALLQPYLLDVLTRSTRRLPFEKPIELSDLEYETFIIDEFQEPYQLELSDQSVRAEMFRCHLLVDVSPEQFAALAPRIRERLLQGRLTITGGVVVAILLLSSLRGFWLDRRQATV
ncbi:MAG: hypothetical protein KDA78_09820 [Planctomycetaceae bacterium]|nr:hypothetical protein [Planctomycetaceae bacterium]